MTSLNRQRANIVFSAFLGSDPGLDADSLRPGERSSYVRKEKGRNEVEEEEGKEWRILTPEEVARQERIFERDGVLRWTFESPPSLLTSAAEVTGGGSSQILGSCRIGVPLKDLLLNLLPMSVSTSPSRSSAVIHPQPSLPQLPNIFASESYILCISTSRTNPNRKAKKTCTATIILKTHSAPQTQLKAWTHALLAAKILSSCSTPHFHTQKEEKEKEKDHTDHDNDRKNSKIILDVISHTLSFLNAYGRFERYLSRLSVAGWDTDGAALEVGFDGRRRVQVQLEPEVNVDVEEKEEKTLPQE